MTSPVTGTHWGNWSGLAEATAQEVLTPRSADDVADAVRRAAAAGTTVKMTGTGHSFTAIAAPEHTLLRPEAMTGIVAVDRDAMTVTARAGTRLHVLNSELQRLGLTLHNMGDIAEQTLAGATSTGTHGSGGITASLSAQLAGLELVTGTGEVVAASSEVNPEVFDHARAGLGALGILTTLTFRVEPLFVMQAQERRATFDDFLESWPTLVQEHHHVDAQWIPRTDGLQLKLNDRLAVPLDEAEPLSPVREWLEHDFLENVALGALIGVQDRFPRSGPSLNRAVVSMIGERTYSDIPHKVFVSRRSVRFKEMEYGVPAEVGTEVLSEVRRRIEASDWPTAFPVEVRFARADDVPLAVSYGRDTLYLAFHTSTRVDHLAYFSGIEPILREAGGRPHWGKLHTRTAGDLAPAYERWGDFQAVRDRLDPDRVFANAYLRRVLGD